MSIPGPRRIQLLCTIPLMIFAVLLGRWYRDNFIPVAEPLASIPDPVKVGSVDDSIVRLKRLIPLMRQANWNPMSVSRSEMYLPDSVYYHDQRVIKDGVPPISFPHLPGWKAAPEYADIAFFTDLYVRSNMKVFKGDKTKNNPKGFYLVGWKNGDVTRVSIDDVRWIKSKQGRKILSFPGMIGYNKKNGMPDPMVRFANGGTDKEKREFFKKLNEGNSEDDCKGCTR